MNAERRRKLAIGSSLREKESQARGDSHSPKWLVRDSAQNRQGCLCSQIIPSIEVRNPKLLLKLKTERKLRVRHRTPKQRKQDSFHIQERGTILKRDSRTMRTPNRKCATDSHFDPMKQRHRRAIADGRRKSARIRRWKQNHIRDVKVRREVINAIARNRRLRAARTEGRAQWWRWQSGRFGMTRRRREKQKRDEQKAKEGLHAGTVGQTWSDRKVTASSANAQLPAAGNRP